MRLVSGMQGPNCAVQRRAVLGMDRIEKAAVARPANGRRQTQDPIQFVGPVQHASLAVPLPITEAGKALRIRKTRFACAQFLGRLPGRRYIVESDEDSRLLCIGRNACGDDRPKSATVGAPEAHFGVGNALFALQLLDQHVAVRCVHIEFQEVRDARFLCVELKELAKGLIGIKNPPIRHRRDA